MDIPDTLLLPNSKQTVDRVDSHTGLDEHFGRDGVSVSSLSRPLLPQRLSELVFVLRSARVRVRQIVHEVLRRPLVPLLADDDVRFPSVLALRGVDTVNVLDKLFGVGVGVASSLFGALAAPRSPSGQCDVFVVRRVSFDFATLLFFEFLTNEELPF
jgi:hypothetical protein